MSRSKGGEDVARRRRAPRPEPRASAPSAPGRGDLVGEIAGLLVAALGVWFFLALSGKGGGALGEMLAVGLRALVGAVGAWAAALFLIWYGLLILYLRHHGRPLRWSVRATGLLLMALAFLLTVQLVQEGQLAGGGNFENAFQGYGGGLIGCALAIGATSLFGQAGRWVLLVTVGLVGFVMNTGITLGGVVNWGKERLTEGARGAKGAAADIYKLATTRPAPEPADDNEPEPVPARRSKAASEELNTIGGAAVQPKTAAAEPSAKPEGSGAFGNFLAALRGKASAPAAVPPESGEPTPAAKSAPSGGDLLRGEDRTVRGDGIPTVSTEQRAAGPVIRQPDPALVEPPVVEPTVIRPAAKPEVVRPEATKTPPARVDQAAPVAKAPAAEPPVPTVLPNGQLSLPPEQLGTAYQLPPLSLLAKPQPKPGDRKEDHLARAELLERTLKTFGVEARVIEISPGPSITRFELQPGEGVRVNKFTALADDLALALAAEDIRIEAPIPGKAAVGIEVPNKERLGVALREVMETPAFLNSSSRLTVAFGKDNAGNPVVGDLAKMPHLLIAGSTGSGKSVSMNTIICSLLFKARPDEVKMMMIDPKMVELSTYNGIPHLIAPVVTDVKKAAGYLKGMVKEMENRYELFAATGARNIQQFNQMVLEDPGPDPEHPRQPLPYIVIFIDELADLMMVAPADVEDSICRLAQMARACGMHLVIATQSPRVDVITGLIKANIPSRIAFAVSNQIDSRVIIDQAGAEKLLGRGDMLYHVNGMAKPMRAQGAWIADKEIEQLVRFVKAQGKPVFTAQEVAVDTSGGKGKGGGGQMDAEPATAADQVFPIAVRVVIEHGQASVSILQRRLRCNYNKAVRLIDMMEEKGYIGPHQGSKPRDVLISMPQWQEIFGQSAAASEPLEE
jgi:S-DNA-T family DNA segregation ATPase FtsK/SpoIIIE